MTPLPPILYRAKTVRVLSIHSLIASIDLGFDTHVHRRVNIEGVQVRDIPPKLRDTALHCMTVLLGGKRLLLRASGSTQVDGPILARVFLDERVHGCPVGFEPPYGLADPKLELGAYITALAADGFSLDAVRVLLNGSKP